MTKRSPEILGYSGPPDAFRTAGRVSNVSRNDAALVALGTGDVNAAGKALDGTRPFGKTRQGLKYAAIRPPLPIRQLAPLENSGENGVPIQPQATSIYSITVLENQRDTKKEPDFYTLREDGFFTTADNIRHDTKQTVREIRNLPVTEQGRIIDAMRSIRDLLGINNFRDVSQLLEDESLRREKSRRAYMLIGGTYGIQGSVGQIAKIVARYADAANEVIHVLQKEELNEHATDIELINDVSSCSDPVKLMLMTFDNSYISRPRFEAKRKLELMILAANIDQREREIGVSDRQAKLDEFLTEYVYSPRERKGQVNLVYYLSTFDPETYACTSVQVLETNHVRPDKTYDDPKTGESRKLARNQKLIRVPRRTFTYSGRDIPLYAKNEPKTMERKILKLIRKGEENPAIAVDDDVRMMGVFDTYHDIQSFNTHLRKSAIVAGSLFKIEGYEDTLRGGGRTDKKGAAAGDQSIRWIKFHARLGIPGQEPIFAEFILHTNTSAMDYEYRRGTAHKEFKAAEFFDRDDQYGSADFLFPYMHYGIDMNIAREERIEQVIREQEVYAAGSS